VKKFWMVIRINPETSVASKRHNSPEEAKAEAERLLNKEKTDFAILETTEYVEYPKPKFDWKKF